MVFVYVNLIRNQIGNVWGIPVPFRYSRFPNVSTTYNLIRIVAKNKSLHELRYVDVNIIKWSSQTNIQLEIEPLQLKGQNDKVNYETRGRHKLI